MYLSRFEEVKMPWCFAPKAEDNVKIVKEMEYREGDVLINVYPKSGSNWSETLIRCLLRTQADEHVLARPSCIDLNKPEIFTSMKSPRVLFSHMWPERMPREHVVKRGKMVLILRNPKDVVVASYHHFTREGILDYSKTWEEHIEAFINGEVFFGDIFTFFDKWQEALKTGKYDMKYFYYEDLKKKPVETLKGIATHIGVQKTDAEIEAIADECSVKNMKKKVAPGVVLKSLLLEDNEYIMIRKGEIGDWKNHFTVAQAERFDKIIEEKMKDSIFKFQYE